MGWSRHFAGPCDTQSSRHPIRKDSDVTSPVPRRTCGREAAASLRRGGLREPPPPAAATPPPVWRASPGAGPPPRGPPPTPPPAPTAKRGRAPRAPLPRRARSKDGTMVWVVDYLEAAESALQTARALADRFNARIILVSVAHAADAEGGDRGDEERQIAGGDPAEAVAQISMDEAADLIIVGARRGLRPGSFRSPLAEDLTTTAPCPVLLPPPQPRAPAAPAQAPPP